jgi:hypothetical protein
VAERDAAVHAASGLGPNGRDRVDLVLAAVATSLLADWGRWSGRFSVIMPRDYRRAMEAKRAAEAAGYDVDVAVMEAARG